MRFVHLFVPNGTLCYISIYSFVCFVRFTLPVFIFRPWCTISYSLQNWAVISRSAGLRVSSFVNPAFVALDDLRFVVYCICTDTIGNAFWCWKGPTRV